MFSSVLYIILGVLMIFGGFALMATPLANFLSTGYYIVILFFVMGIFGIVRGIMKKRYDAEFFLAILSLLMGIIGLVVPGAAVMNSFALLYMAAGWYLLHGVMGIVNVIQLRRELGTGLTVLGVILAVLELIMAIYSVAHPAVLALSLGFLIAFYFIESGTNLIFAGSVLSRVEAYEKSR